MDITILLPTKNRFFYMRRNLKYYDELDYKGKIIILDGSDQSEYDKLKEFIKELELLNIQHIRSDLLPFRAITANLSCIDTEFVTNPGDDDLLIPNGIAQCINHLNNNQDLLAVHGEGVLIPDPDLNRIPPIDGVGPYPGPLRLEDKPSLRAINHVYDYSRCGQSPTFSVIRSKDFKKIFTFISADEINQKCPDDLFAEELLISTLCATYGKIDKIDTLHIMRGHHRNRTIFDNTGVGRKKSTDFFLQKISLMIHARGEQPTKETNKKLRDNLELFLYPQKENITLFYRVSFLLKKIIKKILSFLHILEFVLLYKRYSFNKKDINTQNLLQPTHKYHSDFISVYNSVLSSYNLNK